MGCSFAAHLLIQCKMHNAKCTIDNTQLKTEYSRRKSTPIDKIGGNNPVVVVADKPLNSLLKPDYTADEISALGGDIEVIDNLSNLDELIKTDKPIIVKNNSI